MGAGSSLLPLHFRSFATLLRYAILHPFMTPSPDNSSTLNRPASAYERYLPLFVCLLPALLYLGTLRFAFVYDDGIQILQNPLIRSWHNLPLLLRTDVWAFWYPNVPGHYWRPLFMIWLTLNHSLFGENPVGWHAAAVLTHVLATYFVYRLVNELSGDSVLSAYAALIFAVHPSHLETVAWISGATDSLMADFLLPALLCFIRGCKAASSQRWSNFTGAAVLYLCALLVKEPAVVMPAFALAYLVIWRPNHSRPSPVKSAVLALLPLVLTSLVYLIARRSVLHSVDNPFLEISTGQLLVTIPSLLWFYVEHLLWPIGLGIFYEIPPVLHITGKNFWEPLCSLLVVLGGYLWWIKRTKNRLITFAGVMLLLPILPVLYIPALPMDDFAHDRYLYLPCIGFAIILASLLRQIRLGQRQSFGLPSLQLGFAALIVIALSAATSAQQVYWASDLLLFNRAVQIAPGSANAFINLGTALTARGRMKEARFAYEQVIRRDPKSWMAQFNVGLSYFVDGNYPQAEAYLIQAALLRPTQSDVWAVLAESQNHQGKFAEAEVNIRQAIAVRSYKPGYQRVLALSLEGQGRRAEAIVAAETELRSHPDDKETQRILARLNQAEPAK
jgi:Tfp pilus assembly protein PilF